MKTTLLLLPLLAFIGCETVQPTSQGTPKMTKDTPVFVILDATDVLYPSSVLGEGGLDGLTRRIQKYLVKYLNEHGVKTTDRNTDSQPKLIVKVDTVETRSRSDIGLWSPVVKQDIRMKFNVAMNSDIGAVLFKFDGDESDESIDTLAKKVGERAGSRVPRYFK
jgi:hypothetical protein